MIDSFLQIFLFASIPIPIALLFRGRAEALLISPLVGLATSYVSGILHLFLNIPTVVAWLVIILSSYLLILRSKTSRKQIAENWKRPLESVDYTIVIVGLVFVLGFIWRIPPPLGWDARSIWLFIASWLIEDSQVYVQAHQMIGAGWAAYPFGVPASMAVAWQLYGGVENLWSGVQLVAVLTLSASLLTVKTLLNHLLTSFSIGYQMILSIIITPVFFLVYGGFARNGYMDPLLANLIALTSVCMFILIRSDALTRDERRWLITLSGLSLFCATSVKQEGFWFSSTLLFAYILVDKKSTRRLKLALMSLSLISFLIWKSTMVAVGSTQPSVMSDLTSNFSEIFDLRSEAWKIYGTIIDTYFDAYLFVPTPLVSIFMFTVLLAIISISRKSNVGLLFFATFVWLGNWLIIFATYMFGIHRVQTDAWLASSFDRIVTSQLLFTYVFAAYVFINVTNFQSMKSHNTKEIIEL